jgi:hypothetical protein
MSITITTNTITTAAAATTTTTTTTRTHLLRVITRQHHPNQTLQHHGRHPRIIRHLAPRSGVQQQPGCASGRQLLLTLRDNV